MTVQILLRSGKEGRDTSWGRNREWGKYASLWVMPLERMDSVLFVLEDNFFFLKKDLCSSSAEIVCKWISNLPGAQLPLTHCVCIHAHTHACTHKHLRESSLFYFLSSPTYSWALAAPRSTSVSDHGEGTSVWGGKSKGCWLLHHLQIWDALTGPHLLPERWHS